MGNPRGARHEQDACVAEGVNQKETPPGKKRGFFMKMHFMDKVILGYTYFDQDAGKYLKKISDATLFFVFSPFILFGLLYYWFKTR